MTNIKSTKRAFLASVVAMLICISMLLGTTFAWFTDSVTNTGNIIKTGTLDVEMYWAEGTEDPATAAWTDASTGAIFNNDLWEPGYTEAKHIMVSNEGTLALKYQLTIVPTGEVSVLANVIDVYYIEDATQIESRADLASYEPIGTLADLIYNGIKKGTLTADADYTATLVLKMQDDAGNEYQNLSIGDDFAIQLFATQYAYEEDSFGGDYDWDAPIVTAPIARPTTAVTLKGSEDVKIGLSNDLVNNLPAEITEIGMVVSAPVVDEDAKTITFASIELIDQDGNVIDLESLALGEKIMVTLPAQNTFAPGEVVVLYHDGEYVAAATVNADTTISYEVDHLCEVSIAAAELPEADDSNIITISTATQLFGLAQSVNNGTSYEGKTVVLANDIDLKGAPWTPMGSAYTDHGFMANFDGNGKTISNVNISATVIGGYAYAGFFGVTEGSAGNENYVKDLTIENVTVNTTGNIVAAAIAYPYYTNVSNITVCGDIAIKGGDYTAGVLGYTRRCANASNLTVNGNDGSYITGGITVGGVISDIQLNPDGNGTISNNFNGNYSNFSAANVTVTGSDCVGGISGIICGQTLTGATVNNVTIVCAGTHAGIVSGSFSTNPIINNVSSTDVTGATAIAGAPYSSVATAAYVTIEGTQYAGNMAAFTEQLATGTVNLACDVTVDANTAITLTAGTDAVINLNGNTLAGVSTETGANRSLIIVGKDAKLTVKNGTVSMKHTGANMGWNNSTNALEAVSGGDLTIENVHVINLGGSDMAYAVNIGNNGGATFKAINSTIESVNYNAFRVFNNADGAINIEFTEGTVLTGSGSPFFVHFWTEADLGSKQAARQAFLNVEFNDTVVSRYSGSKSLLRFGFTDAIYYADTEMTTVAVANETALKAALASGKNVVLNNDITVAATSGGYNKAGIIVNNGQTVDGNGYTLTVTGAGATWDCAIYLTNGTVKNITVAGAMRGIFTAGQSADLYIDNVTFKNVIYTFNSDDGNTDYTIYISNCNMNGWTSHSNVHKEVVYTNCSFGEGSGYAFCRPYGPTSFVNCNFAEGYEMDTIGAVTFENCTLNGEAITEANLATLVISNIANATVVEG